MFEFIDRFFESKWLKENGWALGGFTLLGAWFLSIILQILLIK